MYAFSELRISRRQCIQVHRLPAVGVYQPGERVPVRAAQVVEVSAPRAPRHAPCAPLQVLVLRPHERDQRVVPIRSPKIC